MTSILELNAAPAPSIDHAPTPSRSRVNQFAHDLLFVGAGWVVTLFTAAFIYLMIAATFALLPAAFLGVLLLPIILVVAGFSGDLSRVRYNLWLGEKELPALTQKRVFRDFGEYMRTILELRLWLDLLFEMIVAVTVRGLSALILIPWFFAGIGGLFLWIPLLISPPPQALLHELLYGYTDEPSSILWTLADSTLFFLLGAILIASFPFMLHCTARMEGTLTRETLSGSTFAELTLRGWGTALSLQLAPPAWLLIVVLGASDFVGPWSIVVAIPLLCLGLIVVTRRALAGAILALGAYASIPLIELGIGGFRPYGTGGINQWPLTFPTVFMIAFILLFIGAQRKVRLGVVTFGVFFVVSSLALLVRILFVDTVTVFVGAAVVLFFAAITWLAALAGGVGLRSLADTARTASADRDARLAAEAERARAEMDRLQAQYESEQSRIRSSELDERARIAREMHDVVAHSMSLISVQAQTAPYRLADSQLDDATREEFASIAATSRTALGEMRGLLTVLRGAETPPHDAGHHDGQATSAMDTIPGSRSPQMAPQPTLADVPGLVERTRAAGATVTLQMPEAELDQVPPTIGLTLYRAVQEGLSNALRHAPGAPIAIRMEMGERYLLTVENPPPTEEPRKLPSSGYGLRGIRERVGALGGTVSSEKQADGGFTLTVSLPRA